MSFLSRYVNKQLSAYQSDLIQTHYEEVENMYRQVRGWRHDYRNHIQVMKSYAAAGDLEAMRSYLDALEEDLSTVDTVIRTGNRMTDAILNSKISLARARKIPVKAEAHVPVALKTAEIDLCIIIGNLFDNAIEASIALPEEKRIMAVESMARMDRVSPEAIAIVEEEMKRKFATIITSEDNMSLGGVDYVADMMNHVDRSSERKIFEELDKRNPELAQSIREKMFVFENILDMDDRSVQRFVRDCDTKDVVYALKSASKEMQEIFFKNMSKRMSDSVRADLEITTNVRLKDVEEAQQRIVNIIRNLEEKGEVIIKKGGEDDIII